MGMDRGDSSVIKSLPAGCLNPVPSSATQCGQLMHADAIWPMFHVESGSYRRIPTGWDSKQCRKACFRMSSAMCVCGGGQCRRISRSMYVYMPICMPVWLLSVVSLCPSVCLLVCLSYVCLQACTPCAVICMLKSSIPSPLPAMLAAESLHVHPGNVKSEKHEELSRDISTSMYISYPTCHQDILEPPLDAVALTSSVGKQVESAHGARQM